MEQRGQQQSQNTEAGVRRVVLQDDGMGIVVKANRRSACLAIFLV